MKRTLMLLIILAISVTMATSTVAVYTLTLPSEQSDVGNKVFDLFASHHYVVTEPRAMEDAQTWLFKVFIGEDSSGNKDLYVNVSVNAPSTYNLTVSLLDSSNLVMATMTFSGNSSVQLKVDKYIKKTNPAHPRINENLHLSFTYGNGFRADSAYYTVEAYAS